MSNTYLSPRSIGNPRDHNYGITNKRLYRYYPEGCIGETNADSGLALGTLGYSDPTTGSHQPMDLFLRQN